MNRRAESLLLLLKREPGSASPALTIHALPSGLFDLDPLDRDGDQLSVIGRPRPLPQRKTQFAGESFVKGFGCVHLGPDDQLIPVFVDCSKSTRAISVYGSSCSLMTRSMTCSAW